MVLKILWLRIRRHVAMSVLFSQHQVWLSSTPGTANSWQTTAENTRGQRSLTWRCHCNVWWKTQNSSSLRPQRWGAAEKSPWKLECRSANVHLSCVWIDYSALSSCLGFVCLVRAPWLLRPLRGGGEEPEGAVSVPRSHASSPVRRHRTTQDTKAM